MDSGSEHEWEYIAMGIFERDPGAHGKIDMPERLMRTPCAGFPPCQYQCVFCHAKQGIRAPI